MTRSRQSVNWRGGGLEESRRSSSSSDAGGASHDAIRSAGAGTVTGQRADAAHSSMRQHGHLYEEGLKLDLSQILTAASTVQAEALRASDDHRCCTFAQPYYCGSRRSYYTSPIGSLAMTNRTSVHIYIYCISTEQTCFRTSLLRVE